MSAFTPEQQDEMARVIARLVDDGRSSTLIRQLQGGVPWGAGKLTGSETVVVTWPGGSAFSNQITVTHGFGSIARGVLAVQDVNGFGASVVPFLNLQTTTDFKVGAQSLGAAPSADVTASVTVIYWEQ